jgi:hypothetical protein
VNELTCKTFLQRLGMQAINNHMDYQADTPDAWFRCLGVEIGQVADALGRERYEIAAAECIDIAHAAMLLWATLQPRPKG